MLGLVEDEDIVRVFARARGGNTGLREQGNKKEYRLSHYI